MLARLPPYAAACMCHRYATSARLFRAGFFKIWIHTTHAPPTIHRIWHINNQHHGIINIIIAPYRCADQCDIPYISDTSLFCRSSGRLGTHTAVAPHSHSLSFTHLPRCDNKNVVHTCHVYVHHTFHSTFTTTYISRDIQTLRVRVSDEPTSFTHHTYTPHRACALTLPVP